MKCATPLCYAKVHIVNGKFVEPKKNPAHGSFCSPIDQIEQRTMFRNELEKMCKEQYWCLKELYDSLALL